METSLVVEDREVEPAEAPGVRDRVDCDDLSLSGEIGVGSRGSTLYPTPRPTVELPRRDRRAPHHWGDLIERQVEHVVEDERQSFSRSQRVEYYIERETDGVGQEHHLLRVDPVPRG